MSVVHYLRRSTADVSTSPRMNYTVNSCFPSRKPRPNSLKGHKTFKKDIKDTIQHAALINIVAAVNEGIHDAAPRQGSGSTTRSTVTAISNFMSPHEKTVSIPQPKQRIFNMPDEIVQRKPVYYKHSGDLEVRAQSHIRLYEGEAYNLKLKNTAVTHKTNPSAKEIKRLPTKPKLLEIKFTEPQKNKTLEAKHKLPIEFEPRATSGVRRLGSVKKTEPRKIYELSKCNAVDIQETHENKPEQVNSAAADVENIAQSYTPTKIPFVRNKSLPVIFPTKTRNRASPLLALNQIHRQPTIYRDRPLSQNLRKQTPDSMYKRINHLPSGFGYGGMSINNGINQAPDITGKLVHDSEKQPQLRLSLSNNTKQRINLNTRNVDFQTIGHGESNVFITLHDEYPDYQTKFADGRTYKNKHALHEAVRNAMSGRMTRNKYDETQECARSVTSARSKKSCLTSRSGVSEILSDHRTQKKVQFLNSDSSLSSTDTNSLKDEVEVDREVRGGSGVIQNQTPNSVLRAFSPGIQPMSARELLRLEQKILPANNPPPPPDILANYYATNSLINVQVIQRTNSDVSNKVKVNVSPLNDTDNDGSGNVTSKHTEEEHSDRDNLNENKEDSEYKSEVESEFFCDSNGIEDDKEADDTTGFYKLVKALDKQPYDGFEHKKIRRSTLSAKSKDSERDGQKAQYVKIRLS